MDYYKILGVTKNASPEEIKKAFYKLAHKYHPDKGGDAEKFKEINQAYQILSNKEKRAQYDRYGRIFEGTGAGTGNAGFQQRDFNFSNFDFSFGKENMEGLEDVLENIFGFGFSKRTREKKDIKAGEDILITITINLEETLEDQKKEMVVDKYITCSRCGGSGGEPNTKIKECFSCRGTGFVQEIKKSFLGVFTKRGVCPECKGEGNVPEKPCNVCQGEGRIKAKTTVKFTLPKGIDSNQIIKIKELGHAGRRGGKAGDLHVRVNLNPHPRFIRRGDDLYVKINITFSQAVLGDEIKIKTLDGEAILKIPAGTQTNKTFIISKKGISRFFSSGRGDLYVKVDVHIPQKISDNQKKILQELKREGL
jgi:molecular chaperone DnaJ